MLGTLLATALTFGTNYLSAKLNADTGGDEEYARDVAREIERIKGIAQQYLSQVEANSPEANQMISDFEIAISQVPGRDDDHSAALRYAQDHAVQLVAQYRQRKAQEEAAAVAAQQAAAVAAKAAAVSASVPAPAVASETSNLFQSLWEKISTLGAPAHIIPATTMPIDVRTYPDYQPPKQDNSKIIMIAVGAAILILIIIIKKRG